MRVRNFTPHSITLRGKYYPSEGIARCEEHTDLIGKISGIPIVKKSYGAITGLPEPEQDTIYIVSMIVAKAANRPDVFFPADLVRNGNGNIIGCDALSR